MPTFKQVKPIESSDQRLNFTQPWLAVNMDLVKYIVREILSSGGGGGTTWRTTLYFDDGSVVVCEGDTNLSTKYWCSDTDLPA